MRIKTLKNRDSIPSLKLTSSPLKMDGWNLLSYGEGLFSGAFAVSFREGNAKSTSTYPYVSHGAGIHNPPNEKNPQT